MCIHRTPSTHCMHAGSGRAPRSWSLRRRARGECTSCGSGISTTTHCAVHPLRGRPEGFSAEARQPICEGVECWDHPVVLGVVAAASIPLYLKLGRVFFGSLDGFNESVHYWLLPNWFSAARGELRRDWAATAKLQVYVALCFLWAAAITEWIAWRFL